MIKKLCFLVNYNLYESKRYFTEKMGQALEDQKVKVKIVDVREGNLETRDIDAIKQFGPDFTLSYNSFLPLKKNQYLWDILKIPHLALMLDPALYSVSLTGSLYAYLSCVDRNDVTAMHEYNFNRIFFLPHAVDGDLPLDIECDRPYDVAFFGSCYDYENLRKGWLERLPKNVAKVLDDAIDLVMTNQTISLSEALVSAWNASGQSPEGIDFTVLFYYLDYYTRGLDRISLIRSIKDAQVHIFGELSSDNTLEKNGWDHYLGTQSNVTLHPSVNYEESITHLQKAKICLNSMPFFRNGTHERVFNGFVCGALPVTSESLYLREQFEEKKELIFYQGDQMDLLNDKINDLLANDHLRKEGVHSGQQKVLNLHTWDVRAQELVEQLNLSLQHNP